MPAYTTICCSFGKTDRDGLVRRFYTTVFADDVAFKNVFPWACDPELTLDEITNWNQSKLNSDFVLGYDEHVQNDYRQLVLTSHPFSECRLILHNLESEISFHFIVPEDEINSGNSHCLENTCRRIWLKLPATAIESYGEIESPTGTQAIESGQPPSTRLFALIDYDCTNTEYAPNSNIERMDRGYFLKPNDA